MIAFNMWSSTNELSFENTTLVDDDNVCWIDRFYHLPCPLGDNMFYDQGWDAYVKEEPFDETKSEDWRDGYLDAQSIKATFFFPKLVD